MKWLISAFMAVTISIWGVPSATAVPSMTQVQTVEASQPRERSLESLQIQMQKASNKVAINRMVNKLESRVGKTPYVFSGWQPSGWDCSGMVMWGYKQLGVELHHSASSEKNSGTIVKTPMVGDIVAFGYKGWSGASHVGIYIGNDKMIHAGGGSGDRTSIQSISQWAKWNGNSKVTYTRILQTK